MILEQGATQPEKKGTINSTMALLKGREMVYNALDGNKIREMK